MNPSKGTRLVRLHRTQRTALPRLLGSLLLVTAAGISSAGCGSRSGGGEHRPGHRRATSARADRARPRRSEGRRIPLRHQRGNEDPRRPRLPRRPEDRRLPGGRAAPLHRVRPAGHRQRWQRRHPATARLPRQQVGRGGLHAEVRPRIRHHHRAPPGRALPRRPDAASAAPGRCGEEKPSGGPLEGRGRRGHGRAALRLPGRDARCLPALLHGHRGQALHRPVGPLQDEQVPPASLRRPGLAHRHRFLAAARHVRRSDGGRRRSRMATTRRATTGRSSGTRPRATWRSCRRSICRATRTRHSPRTPS